MTAWINLWIFLATWGTGLYVIYAAVTLFKRRKSGSSSRSYFVLERDGRRMAIRNSPYTGLLMGFAYVTLMILSLPLMAWSYGLRKAGLLALAPIGMIVIVILSMPGLFLSRVAFSVLMFWIARNLSEKHMEYRDEALARRGWRFMGKCRADSARAAREAMPGKV